MSTCGGENRVHTGLVFESVVGLRNFDYIRTKLLDYYFLLNILQHKSCLYVDTPLHYMYMYTICIWS